MGLKLLDKNYKRGGVMELVVSQFFKKCRLSINCQPELFEDDLRWRAFSWEEACLR